MVSRRKILSRSRDNLNVDNEEEDVWHQKDKLFKVCFQKLNNGISLVNLNINGNCRNTFKKYSISGRQLMTRFGQKS